MKRLVYSHILTGLCLAVAVIGREGDKLLAQSQYEEIEVTNGGTIHGTVHLSGEAPSVRSFEVTKNQDQCGVTKPSPRLSVGNSNGVRNAVVFIEEITQGKAITRTPTAVLDQRDCEYDPHVLIHPLGEPLHVVNSDSILHNVHAYQIRATRPRSILNVAQPRQGQRITISARRFRTPGRVLAICDAGHPWMSAHIIVAEHPYYTMTDESGEFTLDHVPPGSYRLRMWHEGIAVIQTELADGKPKRYYFEEPYETVWEVIVPPNGEVRVDFELTLR